MQTQVEFPLPPALGYEADTASKRQLVTKADVGAHPPAATTRAGIVVLHGFVNNLLAGQHAKESARAGRRVVNELLVRAPNLPEAELLAIALAAGAARAHYDGQAGLVPAWTARTLAPAGSNHLRVRTAAQPATTPLIPADELASC